MAIKFFNIRSKETRIAETEPMISALWASSDHSPNITQGQDFGWRLAPEVVVEMKRIRKDIVKLQEIALRYKLSMEDIGEKEILRYISDKTNVDNAPVAEDEDYSDEYNDEIRRLERQAVELEPTTTTTTEEQVLPTTTTTTEPPVTITTTEEPVTTTTTTEDENLTTTTTENIVE